MILMSPITLPSTGIQAFFAWYLGDRTDEGIDARTTYHFLAAMFSPILFWLPMALVTAFLMSSTFLVEHRHSYVDFIGNTYLKLSFPVWL